jgi:hypothetical protein
LPSPYDTPPLRVLLAPAKKRRRRLGATPRMTTAVSELHDLFSASVGASAALIGLLFVAISLGPEKIFGALADPGQRADAVGAFTALANIFFVSLTGLIPHVSVVTFELIALLSIARIVSADVTMVRLFPGHRNWRDFGIISIGLYGLEALFAARHASSGGAPVDLIDLLLGLYSYALGVAWKLLGAGDRPRA